MEGIDAIEIINIEPSRLLTLEGIQVLEEDSRLRD